MAALQTTKPAQGGVTEAMPKWANGAPMWEYIHAPANGKELVERDEAEARIKEAALSAQQGQGEAVAVAGIQVPREGLPRVAQFIPYPAWVLLPPGIHDLFTAPPAQPAERVPEGMLDHLREALRRIEDNRAPRRIPAEPGDVDLALSEVIAWMEGRPAPFWIKRNATPAAPAKRVPEEAFEEAGKWWVRMDGSKYEVSLSEAEGWNYCLSYLQSLIPHPHPLACARGWG